MSSDRVLPLFGQVKAYVIEAVERGELRPGEQIPSQRELCRRFGISLMTARRAINELIGEGVIYALPGKGLFVAARKQQAESGPLVGFSEDMQRRGMKPSSRLLESGLSGASAFLARTLGVETGVETVYIRRLRLADGLPIAVQSNFVIHRFCPGLLQHNLEHLSLFEVLREVYGMRLNASRVSVESLLATEEEARLLGVELPAALLMSEQITFLDDGRAVEFARTKYRGDRYRITSR
jgi:GntR family transcriptional regulator